MKETTMRDPGPPRDARLVLRRPEAPNSVVAGNYVPDVDRAALAQTLAETLRHRRAMTDEERAAQIAELVLADEVGSGIEEKMTPAVEFKAWPKTPRLFRDVVVTEKIDGTNACIFFEEHSFGEGINYPGPILFGLPGPDEEPSEEYWAGAQSRSRLITPADDNFGFGAWVWAHAQTLFEDLGPGRHYGEWWGKGIQRNYGLDHRRFSLFNTAKWGDGSQFTTDGLHVVPVLYEGPFREHEIGLALRGDSVAAPGFDDPEGVCIYHTASRQVFKYTFDGDGHKG